MVENLMLGHLQVQERKVKLCILDMLGSKTLRVRNVDVIQICVNVGC